MRVVIQVVLDVDAEKWAENNNGPWPEDDKRSLNTAVRQDIKSEVTHLIDSIDVFDRCGVKVDVR